jgi:putative endopeptidase
MQFDQLKRSFHSTRFATAFAIGLSTGTIAGLVSSTESSPGAQTDGSSAAVLHYGTWGLDLTARDLTVNPGTDFFLHAVGSWLKRTGIPADRVTFGVNEQLRDLTEGIVHKLIEDAAAGRSGDPDAAKIGAAFTAFMNEAEVERLDAAPLASDLAAIRAEETRADVAALMGRPGIQPSIFGIAIAPDDRAPNQYAVSINLGGLGLPDRDYYLTDQLLDRKAKYQAYVALILGMIHWDAPDVNARAVVDFETRIAQASWTLVDKRDPEKMYHPMSVSDLVAFAPGFDFGALLSSRGLGREDHRLIVTTDTAFPRVAAIFHATPLDTLKAWQAFHLASGAAAYLSKRFVDARFDFYDRTLSGQPENRPRWKRAVAFVNDALGVSVGRMYVTEHFPPESKSKMDALVKEMVAAMHKRIDRLDWMSPATKARAHEKLSKMNVKIGYPAKWRDYDALTMVANDLYGNIGRTRIYEWNYVLKRLHRAVDKEEWEMTPQTVDDYYSASNNEIVFPAAQLQPPFFDPAADPAVNYGGIGAIIGHEMVHGFDDSGRKYDGDGVLNDWWTPEDTAAFNAAAGRLAAQFGRFEPVAGHFINGHLTAAENIADLGGLLLALDAYHAASGGKEPPMLDGLTGDQRFFLAYAQGWRGKARDEATIRQLRSNEHAPDRFRVNGPIRNVAEWYDAFKIMPEDVMYIAPDKRVRIW